MARRTSGVGDPPVSPLSLAGEGPRRRDGGGIDLATDREHPNRAPAKRFLDKVKRGEIEAHTSTEVLQEILYRYSSLKRLDLAAQVYDLFVQICPVVFPVNLADTDRAKVLVCGKAAVAPRDALHAAVMLNNGVSIVASFDNDFDRIPGIKRYEMT